MAGVRRAPAIFFMPPMTLHPATLLLGWLACAIALQWMPLLPLLVAALAVLPAAGYFARRRFGLLLRRSRWLLLSIALLFSLATPGTALPDPLGALGLTTEGCLAATAHVLRLALLLALLALLLEHQTIPRLIGGLYLLLTPFEKMLDRGRIALRLLLVLEYVERNHATKHWNDWLTPQQSDAVYPPLELAVPPLAAYDCIIIVIGFGIIGAILLLA